MTARRKQLGADGEAAAAERYVHDGYELLARNWRCSDGEIDVIASRSGELVFVEVKTRTTNAFGTGAEAVGWRKQQQVRRLAARWISECCSSPPRSIRFDVADVTITAGRLTVEVLEAAF